MPLSLIRIDDRLIHGQVVLGWSRVLKPDRIVVANDRIAKNAWERKFYTASVPPHIKVSFLTLDETAVELLNNLYKNESVLMLFESVEDLFTLVQKGIRIEVETDDDEGWDDNEEIEEETADNSEKKEIEMDDW